MKLAKRGPRDLVPTVALILCLFAVCLPRFDRRDLGLGLTPGGRPATRVLGDAAHYIELTRFYRGESTDAVRAPFAFRPLAPWLAARLPFAPMTAINLLNLLALSIALVRLERLLRWLGVDERRAWLGGGLFTVSFPTFYYGTIGYVDPVLVCFLVVGTECIARGRWISALLVLGLGALAKETIVLLLPVLAVRLLQSQERSSARLVLLLAGLGITVSALAFARLASPVAEVDYFWTPTLDRLIRNLSRPRAAASIILSFGVPGLLSLYLLTRPRRSIPTVLWPLTAGLAASLALSMYSLFGAYADGRPIWTSVAFSIPIAMVLLPERSAWSSGSE